MKILCDGALEPDWSIRTRAGSSASEKTVFGRRPVVCFSEMPIMAFCEYLEARSPDGNISGYGVLLHKKQVFAEGGRPVIYDSEPAELTSSDSGYDSSYRLLKESRFSEDLQYRVVATNLGAERTLDWTHEREWRWPKQEESQLQDRLYLFGSGFVSGDGAANGRPHVFVEREEDVQWLQCRLRSYLTQREDGDSDYRVKRYLRVLRTRSGVISLEKVRSGVKSGDRRYARLESWPEEENVDIVGEPRKTMPAGELFVR
ncbi:MAG: hypothetical protein AB1Z98_20960 [Nannocystaceae bacterium]